MAREIGVLPNLFASGYECTGITIQMQQGDVKVSKFYPGVTSVDYNKLAESIEATGQFTCTGFSPVFRDKAVKEGTVPVVEGTTEKVNWGNIILQRFVKVGEQDVKAGSLYLMMPIPVAKANREAMEAKLKGQTIGGALVKDVKRNTLGGMAD